MWGVSLIHPMLTLFLCGEFLLHIPSCIGFYRFPCTSRAGFIFFFFFCGEFLLHIPCFVFMWGFLLHIPCCLVFLCKSLSYTSRAGFVFYLGIFLHIPCWLHFYPGSFSYTSRAGFIVWGISPTHPVLASLSGEFLLHVLC